MDDSSDGRADEVLDHFNAIRRLSRRGVQAHLEQSGLTMPQVNLLRALAREDGLTVDELGRRMCLAHSTVSGIVDRLAKKGLVERRVDEFDRRRTRVFTSSAVTRYIESTSSPWVSLLSGALARASESERTGIVDSLCTLRRLLEEQAADSGDSPQAAE